MNAGIIRGVHPPHFIQSNYSPVSAHASAPLPHMSMHAQYPFSGGPPLDASQFVAMAPGHSLLPPAPAFGIAPGKHPDSHRRFSEDSETTAIPPYLRGPPRKPKQSGYAMWVGNLAPAVTIVDLKDFFSRDATRDIESVFLISRTGCAFVNYGSEASCMAAIDRFHNSHLLGMRMVCRRRRAGDSSAASSSTEKKNKGALDREATGDTTAEEEGETRKPERTAETSQSSEAKEQVRERFFVLKSLTTQDLESSVRTGNWATQLSNETTLNDAFTNAEDVYLIFSANKSGQYFGYARMTSKIDGEPIAIAHGALPDSPGVVPTSNETPPTATAPRGWIYDDSARGTVFWEAEKADEQDAEGGDPSDRAGSRQKWSKQFTVEWMCTKPLPFRFTRGLRNPWNDYQEVKIARDGTELEPRVGRLLMQMFHQRRPSK